MHTSNRILALSTLLTTIAALPFPERQSHGNSRFAIVNVDGSSEPPSPPPAVTDTVTKTLADAITVPAYVPPPVSPTQTITVTFAPTISSRAVNSSSLVAPSTSSLGSSSVFSYTRNSTILTASSIFSSSSSIPAPPPSTPCTSTTPTTSSSSSTAPSPTAHGKPEDCDDDDDDDAEDHHNYHHGPPSDGAPWRPKATSSTLVTSVAKPSYSYPASARAALPSGMTAPLPVLPTEAPVYVNKTQIPHYRKEKRDIVLDDFVEVLV